MAENTVLPQPVKPRLRGVLHEWGFFASLGVGLALAVEANGSRGRVSAIVFAASVSGMLGASALYHRVTWSPSRRLWLRRLDHAMIYILIAGTYTPVALIVLSGSWRVTILAFAWSGAAAAVLLKFVWVAAPKWLAAVFGIGLGWVGVVAFPQLIDRAGLGGALLLLAGGLLYTAGALVYAFRRPDPAPATFGYHELFHALVVGAVVCQYCAIAFYVLPLADGPRG
ncbi:MAG: hemolysin [Gaiellaceae bacterium]|jgi:hemolysin III|nr:hemolysin [Gaiellaceae bacterium]